ncbi:hypothetical protein ACKLNR_004449 [Fusarium oxysporum f. sp. zingiberi]
MESGAGQTIRKSVATIKSNKGIPSHYSFWFQYFLFDPFFRFFLNQYCSEREFRGLQKLIIDLTETPQYVDDRLVASSTPSNIASRRLNFKPE